MTACMSLECVCNSSLLGKQTGGTGKLREPRETGQMKETIMAGQLISPQLATSGEDEDVIVTGVSYADATRKKTQQSRDTNGTTYIGKNVRFSNNTSQNKQPYQKPKQYYPGQGRQYSPSYPNAPNPNLTNTQSRPPAQQGYNTYGQRPSPTERQSNNYVPNNYDRNPRQNQNLQSNDFLYPRSRQSRRR